MRAIRLCTFALMAALLVFSTVAQADTLTWTLTGVRFDDGGTANGTFTFDSDTNSILNWNLTTTAGGTLGAFSYNSGDGGSAFSNGAGSNDFFFDDAANDRYMRLNTLSGLTGPGTVGLGGGQFGEGYECTNCGNVRFIVDGEVTSTPEPGSLALLGSGLVGLAGGLRRKLMA